MHFITITSQLGEDTVQLYLERLDEGYDLKGVYPLFDTWRGYYQELENKQAPVSLPPPSCMPQLSA